MARASTVAFAFDIGGGYWAIRSTSEVERVLLTNATNQLDQEARDRKQRNGVGGRGPQGK